MKKIVLAGGCFWGVEAYFKQLKGVVDTSSGYANGNFNNPTYEQVCKGIATHAEAVSITYDEKLISLEKLLEHFFRIIDPTSLNKQGNDVGLQYRSGIYYTTEVEKQIAETYIQKEQLNYDKSIVVSVEPLTEYYLAEEYHQDYLDKNPNGYCHIDLGLVKADEVK
ncbi:peptide-methionine (S)-S-oxide reductase MsrA, partial [Acholeplasma granularum]|uniref:peptide-methionine (S)-S-oxide reductase MsrA n=1 Tax=Acholeplasma granularum TaxID=264635 RepID=UPI0004B35E9F